MRRHNMRGAEQGKAVKTTQPNPAIQSLQDRVKRDFPASRPNQAWVADST